MNVLWINPKFLDYRIPVYDELNKLLDNKLTVVYSVTTPERVSEKIKKILKDRAICLDGERFITIGKKVDDQSKLFANKILRIPYQPGLLKAVRSTKPDIIIIEGFFQWSPVGYLMKLFSKSTLVLSYERTEHTERNAPKWRELYRKIALKLFIDSCIVNGTLSKEYVNRLGMAHNKIIMGGMSADSDILRVKASALDKKQSKKQWGLDPEKFVYIHVGQLISRKGVFELIKAWDMFGARDSVLVFAGEGEEKEKLQDYCKNNELNNVIFLEKVDYSLLPSLYTASDVLISSTLEDNWSLVVPEAMCCGLPIACSIYNGCYADLIVDGVNGKIFDPLNQDDFINCLKYFKNDSQLLTRMGAASIELERKFSPKNAALNIIEAINVALDAYNK